VRGDHALRVVQRDDRADALGVTHAGADGLPELRHLVVDRIGEEQARADARCRCIGECMLGEWKIAAGW
jgi:hypothetical protein